VKADFGVFDVKTNKCLSNTNMYLEIKKSDTRFGIRLRHHQIVV